MDSFVSESLRRIFKKSNAQHIWWLPKSFAEDDRDKNFIDIFVDGYTLLYGAVILAHAGKDVLEQIKDGTIECEETNFVVRKAKTKAFVYPGHKLISLSSQQAAEMLGKPVEACTPSLASELRAVLKPLNYKELKKRSRQKNSSTR